jgi:hypothetical protein
MNRLSTPTLTVFGALLAQAPADSANIEVGNQVLISSHDRIEVQKSFYMGTPTPLTRKIG